MMTSKQKTNLFYLLIFILVFNIGYTQQKTTYEKKIESLNVKFAKDLGAPQLVNKYKGTGDFGAFLATGELARKLNTEKGLLLLLKYKEEVKNAEKLKSPQERKLDKDKKDKEIALLKAKEQQEKEQREQRQKEEEINAQQRELKQKFYTSDYYYLTNQIKTDFERWLEKTDFEKKEDYQNRVTKSGSNVFDSICRNEITELIKHKTGFYQSPRIHTNIGKYDSENEFFEIKITSNVGVRDYYIINDTIKVEMLKARRISNLINKTDGISYSKYKNISDWCLIDNMLFPKIIILNSGEKINKSLMTSSKKINNFNFSTKELDIKNEYLAEIVYDYEKQQKQDQIDIENEKTRKMR